MYRPEFTRKEARREAERRSKILNRQGLERSYNNFLRIANEEKQALNHALEVIQGASFGSMYDTRFTGIIIQLESALITVNNLIKKFQKELADVQSELQRLRYGR